MASGGGFQASPQTRQLASDAADQNERNRIAQLVYAGDKDAVIDEQTRMELITGLRPDSKKYKEMGGKYKLAGGIEFDQQDYSPGEAESIYEQAKAGVGIYGVRKLNQERVKIMMEKPGKRQTVLSQGPSSNNATSGLLTGVQS